mgnify:FL=1
MYSEIKNNNQILINRLDENEAILLKNFYDESQNSTLSLIELNGETGDFSGIILEKTPIAPKKVESQVKIPVKLDIYPNEEYVYTFKTNVEDAEVLFNQDNYDYLEVKAIDNTLVFNTTNLVNAKVNYEVRKEGYKPLRGYFDLASIPRKYIILQIKTTPEDANIVLKDSKDTQIEPVNLTFGSNEKGYAVEEGFYTVEVSNEGYETVTQQIEILANDMLYKTKELEIVLMGIITDPDAEKTE